MKKDILQVAGERTVLFDGGIGTQLQALGLPIGTSPEQWNKLHPERIAAVHRAYLTAGAEVLTTNSFGGSPLKLAAEKVAGDPEEINYLAAKIAREAAGESGWVAGSIGPTGVILAMSEVGEEEIFSGFSTQAQGLARGGVDLIMIETMSDLTEAMLAVKAARSVVDLPVFVSLTFSPGQRGYRTMMGVDIPQAAAALSGAGISVLGCNCGTGIDDAIAIVTELKSNWNGLILSEPNAGLPELVEGKTVYRETAEKMAARIPELVRAGAHFVGGCCGTTPGHIQAFRKELGG
jgi:5-methyltetrahydrofolate--homocysteine methyltransferase